MVQLFAQFQFRFGFVNCCVGSTIHNNLNVVFCHKVLNSSVICNVQDLGICKIKVVLGKRGLQGFQLRTQLSFAASYQYPRHLNFL